MPKTADVVVSIESRHRRLVEKLVRSGRYASPGEVIHAAMRLLEAVERDRAEELEAIRRGLEDVKAGRTRPAEEVFADLERKYPDVRRRRARRGA